LIKSKESLKVKGIAPLTLLNTFVVVKKLSALRKNIRKALDFEAALLKL